MLNGLGGPLKPVVSPRFSQGKRIMNRKVLVGIALAVMIVAVLLVLMRNWGKGPDAGKPQVMRVAYLPILVCSPFFVAQELGYFREEGVEILPQKFVSSNQMAEALLLEKTDAAMSLAHSVAVTVEAKQPGQMKVFMVNAQNSKQYLSSLVVRRDSPIQTMADLKGKRIGSVPGQTARVYLEIMLENQGIDPKKDVQIKELDLAIHLQALESGSIDALLTYEPTTTIGIERGLVRPLIQGAFEKNVIDPWIGGVFVLRTGFANEQPEKARHFVKALERAVDYINTHADEYKLMLPKYTPIDETIARKTTNIPYWRLHEIDTEQLQRQTNLLFEKGVIPKRIDTRTMYYSQ